MSQKKLTKEDLKSPDAFITFSDKVIGWLERHKGPIITLFVATFVLGGSYVGWGMLRKHSEKSAQEELYSIEASLNQMRKKLPEDHKPESLDKDFPEMASRYQSFIEANKNHKAGAIATLNFVDLLVEYDQIEKAQSLLDMIGAQFKPNDFFSGLLTFQLARLNLKQQNYDKAISLYQKLLGENSHKHLHAQSLLNIGLSY
ncbi:MAG: tetratricopeptide repeat protein, partial [Bdellovibrionales bacterium]|nr:tetratricopeptide repeat protein [Bdellovibrionales bacterium]